jgi:single-stranded-DNA-specific exonuclease
MAIGAQFIPSLPRCDWDTAVFDAAAAAALSAACKLPPPVAGLLAARGLTDPEAVDAFLHPSLQGLGDPFALPGIEAAARVLHATLAEGGEIVVYGDFDADGVVATALLTGVLRELGGRVRPFLPDRHSEGYGLTRVAVDHCLREGVPRLLITVDCGMGAAEEIARIGAAGARVIVTDHHAVTGGLPDDCLVVNPRLPGAPAGVAHLCGAGVAFKLAHGVLKLVRAGGGTLPDLRDWLDAVALATVADVVPLLGENRILVAAGLSRLSRRPRAGLRALMQRAGLAGPVNSHHLGFVLGPRINASGRMRSAWPAFALLGAGDADQAMEQAILLEQLNAERRQVEQEVLRQAELQIARGFDAAVDGAVVTGGTEWHAGTIGIVAARLSERHQRPAAVVALDAAGGGRGSVRAGQAYDAMAALAACEAWLTRYGGHARAGGFNLRPGAFAQFSAAFAGACRAQVGAPSRRPRLTIDGWLAGREIDAALWRAICQLEPFGEGHPRPCWGLRGARLTAPPRTVGRAGEHLRLSLRSADGLPLEAVWFRAGAWLPAVAGHGGAFDVAGTLHASSFGGAETLEWQVADMRPVAAASRGAC